MTDIDNKYDCFISHASEDKDDFVRELANNLKKAGLNVWYDEYELLWGDSLRESIDFGLANSVAGIVVLSHNFFNKDWPKTELDGLVAKKNSSGKNLIIPIWHKITQKEICDKSPILAGLLAGKSDMEMSEICKNVKLKINKLKGLESEKITIGNNENVIKNDKTNTFLKQTKEFMLEHIRDFNYDVGHAINWRSVMFLLMKQPPHIKKYLQEAVDLLVNEGVLEENNGNHFLTEKGYNLVYN